MDGFVVDAKSLPPPPPPPNTHTHTRIHMHYHYYMLQEREARLALMRKRAHERDGYSDEDEPITRKERRVSPEASVATERGHINFFADIKQGVSHKGFK